MYSKMGIIAYSFSIYFPTLHCKFNFNAVNLWLIKAKEQ
ncbi:hypothetical protein MNB_SV-13-1448 [hydrothermal vent metagenome]|uniref:Uncharacterized protein n=1 Tax=hydrothermal vent metagenome TaxID=652676 RepID=A0A1W1D078_9ZZZZ